MPSKKSHLKLYADECFPITSVTFLKSLGYSVIHAFDLKLVKKPDLVHLRTSKRLGKVLITLDRDFIYYEQVNLNQHPGVIIISVSSAIPSNINNLCKKALKIINMNFAKDSLIKVTNSKLVKLKGNQKIYEKDL